MMVNVAEVSQMITAMAAVAAVCVSMVNMRKINAVHLLTNSMKDQLVASTGQAEHAKGVIVGRAEVVSEEGAAALARATPPRRQGKRKGESS